MSDIVLNISIPLDDEKFLRRECPHCVQEFKVQISPEDLISFADKRIKSFLTDDDNRKSDGDEEEITKYFCPYCGQEAPTTDWWTQEQLSYLMVYTKNIMAKTFNDEFIKPMKRNINKSSGLSSISFKGSEMKYEDPWISDEVNDMRVFDLPCCNEKVKIIEDWRKNIFCFYCGFKYEMSNGV